MNIETLITDAVAIIGSISILIGALVQIRRARGEMAKDEAAAAASVSEGAVALLSELRKENETLVHYRDEYDKLRFESATLTRRAEKAEADAQQARVWAQAQVNDLQRTARIQEVRLETLAREAAQHANDMEKAREDDLREITRQRAQIKDLQSQVAQMQEEREKKD